MSSRSDNALQAAAIYPIEGDFMPPRSVMIKPASSSCNLRCRYCFYADEAAVRGVANYGIMRDTTLETLISKFLSSAQGSCSFVFQGGEPTLAGLDFFKKVVLFERKYNTKNLKIFNALQTNGMVLEDEWCAFLANNHFLVGLSLDGVKDTHDLCRVTPDLAGTYSRVLHAVQILEKHHVEFNILTVVTAQLAKNITKVYGFYKKNHFLYQQYIPCMDALGYARGQNSYSLTPRMYGDFLNSLFDLWYQDLCRGLYVSIRYFDNLLRILNRQAPESCSMTGQCNIQYLAEADGSVYPCDFYALDQYQLGNVLDNSIEELDQRRTQLRFIEDSLQKPEECHVCRWFALCRGGCRRDCIDGAGSKNYYCESYQLFFEHALPRLKQATAMIAR